MKIFKILSVFAFVVLAFMYCTKTDQIVAPTATAAELAAPWGAKTIYTTNFDHRSLFARRGHSPIWLELLAYGIVAVVWAVIIYLLFQIRNIKKLGLE